MRWILRLILLLVVLALALAGLAWALATQTDVPGRVLTAGFNEGNPTLWLEARGARLHGDLLGARLEGLSLAARDGRRPILRVERFDAGLGALPVDGVVSVDHVEADGVQIDLDEAALKALTPLEQRAGEPPAPDRPHPSVRIGRLALTGASVTWRGAEGTLAASDLDLQLSGVVGPVTDASLALSLGAATLGQGEAPATLGRLALEATVKTSADGAADVQIRQLTLAGLQAGAWSLGPSTLGPATLAAQGLGGRLAFDALTLERLAGPELELVDARLALDLTGSLAGVQVTRLALVSPRLSVNLTGSARPTLGLSGAGLALAAEGTFEADLASLHPTACEGVPPAKGALRLGGDLRAGRLVLASLTLSLAGAAPPREVTRADVPLPDGAALRALLTSLCAEARPGAP